MVTGKEIVEVCIDMTKAVILRVDGAKLQPQYRVKGAIVSRCEIKNGKWKMEN